MKNTRIILALILIITTLTSCRSADSNEPVNMDELMKIRTWMLDKDLEGKGRWAYDNDNSPENFDSGNGYWISDDGVTEVANEDVFVYEALEVGVPRTMAPLSFHMIRKGKKAISYANLIFNTDYDGIVKVEKIEPNDSSIQLRHALGSIAVKEDSFSIQGPCTVEVYPIGKVMASESDNSSSNFIVDRDTVAGKEYTIQIQACSQA